MQRAVYILMEMWCILEVSGSGSQDSHTKCLKFREMNLTVINCTTDIDENKSLPGGSLFVWQIQWHDDVLLNNTKLELCFVKFSLFQI